MVVRFKDGTTLAGFGDNFMPGEESILVADLDGHAHEIRLQEVKLVCFVRNFVGDSQSHAPSGQLLYQAVPGRKIRLKLKDGEELRGVSSLSELPRNGFFMTPLNPNSNNIHIYVNRDVVLSFAFES